MTTLEILKAARRLIETPNKWTKEDYATASDGSSAEDVASVGVYFQGAVCFCLDGALMQASNSQAPIAAYNALGFKAPTFVHDWNDAPERTHAEVLARLDAAIAAEEAKAAHG